MKNITLFLITAYCLTQTYQSSKAGTVFSDGLQKNLLQTTTIDSSILGVFAGKSPCLEIAKELNIPVDADCFKLKWDLTLYYDPATHAPTRYKLGGTFYRKGIREGTWTIIKGTKTNPDAIVYQLDPDKPQGSLFFLKADDNILFFLDKNRNLLVGSAEFSYTLNRVKN